MVNVQYFAVSSVFLLDIFVMMIHPVYSCYNKEGYFMFSLGLLSLLRRLLGFNSAPTFRFLYAYILNVCMHAWGLYFCQPKRRHGVYVHHKLVS